MNVKLRLYGFAVAVVLLAALVGWAGNSVWQQLKQLRKNFGSVQSESFHLADHVESSVLNLNETVLRFDLRKDPADKAHFHKEGEELKRWIRKSSVTTSRELDLLNQIDVASEAWSRIMAIFMSLLLIIYSLTQVLNRSLLDLQPVHRTTSATSEPHAQSDLWDFPQSTT